MVVTGQVLIRGRESALRATAQGPVRPPHGRPHGARTRAAAWRAATDRLRLGRQGPDRVREGVPGLPGVWGRAVRGAEQGEEFGDVVEGPAEAVERQARRVRLPAGRLLVP